MRSIVSSIRNRYRRNLEEQTAALDSDVRTKLAQDVEESLQLRRGGGHDATATSNPTASATATKRIGEMKELQEIEDELEKSRECLEKMEKSESFITKRINSYCTKLDERKFQLKQREEKLAENNNNNSVEEADKFITNDEIGNNSNEVIEEGTLLTDDTDLERAMEKYRKDEEALLMVIETQKESIANIERIRRQIHVLELKRDDILKSIKECREFLVAAAEVDHNETEEEEAMMMGGAYNYCGGVGGGEMPSGEDDDDNDDE